MRSFIAIFFKTKELLKSLFLLISCFALAISNPITAQRDLYWGFSAGINSPSNIGASSDELGFKTVANTGFNAGGEIRWFFQNNLSLGGELSYLYFPKDNYFWDVNQYGQVNANYHMIGFQGNGIMYFEGRDIKPYTGIAFGMTLIANKFSFNATNQFSSATNVNYSSTNFKPGFAPLAGLLITLSKKSYLTIELRYQFIPFLRPTVNLIYDEYGNIINNVVLNPQGNQNYWMLKIGYLFSK